MKNPWIIPVATLVVGAAGGYISGKGTSPEAVAPGIEASNARNHTSSRSDTSSGEATKKNHAASTEQIARMPGNSSRIQALLEFYQGLSASQLADEAGKLDALPMNERIMASILLFGRWAEVDAGAAMAFSNTMGFAGGFVRPTILQSWSSVDPAGAAKYYAANPREFATMGMMGGRGPGGGQDGASIIASEWARQDPTAAMAWAASLTTDKGSAMTSVIGEIAKTDPRKAADMIKQMDAADQGNAYRSVAAQYGALDFAEAQSWVRTLPADDQAAAHASAIGGLANSDPAAAAKQALLMPDGDAKDRLVGNIVGTLARTDPQAAAEFLSKQESENAQRDGMRNLMPTWANQNPAAALKYAQSLPDGNVRDSALGSYVFGNNTTPSKELVATAEGITDEGDRNRAVIVATSKWLREDKTAATAYIESSDMSDDQKQRLIEGRGMFGGGPPGGGGGGNRRGR
jgi:hypothetical protein